ncbi:hypothetical protein V6N12_049020 [Hibiscus sabdariffa]|uniref:Uncharacterized protein n=1 Tax=Hibiscus sabdariffa TaxID=183260 RepID=A0ABR2EJC1_9ROSI
MKDSHSGRRIPDEAVADDETMNAQRGFDHHFTLVTMAPTVSPTDDLNGQGDELTEEWVWGGVSTKL